MTGLTSRDITYLLVITKSVSQESVRACSHGPEKTGQRQNPSSSHAGACGSPPPFTASRNAHCPPSACLDLAPQILGAGSKGGVEVPAKQVPRTREANPSDAYRQHFPFTLPGSSEPSRVLSHS